MVAPASLVIILFFASDFKADDLDKLKDFLLAKAVTCPPQGSLHIVLPYRAAVSCSHDGGSCRQIIEQLDVSSVRISRGIPENPDLITKLINSNLTNPDFVTQVLFLTNVMCEDYGNYPDLRNVNKSQSIAESIVTNRINITAWWINPGHGFPDSCTPSSIENDATIKRYHLYRPVPMANMSEVRATLNESCYASLTTSTAKGSSRAQPTSAPHKEPINKPLLIAIISVCVTLMIVAICCGCLCLVRMKYRYSMLRLDFLSSKNRNGPSTNHYMVPMQTVESHPSKSIHLDKWEIDMAELDVHENEKLGSGAFAAVFKGKLKGQNPLLENASNIKLALEMAENKQNEVAVKMLHQHADEASRIDFNREIQFMKELGYHPHILNVIGCVSSTESPLLVVEYCAHGDLLNLLRRHKKYILTEDKQECPAEADFCLTIKDLVSFAWQISDGMNYLASRNYIHRDVAARNVLVTRKMVAKVSDFGLCRYSEDAFYTTKGGRIPIKWMSVEALKHAEYSTKSDVYSYGILLWEIFTIGDTPFPTVQPGDMIRHLEDGNVPEKPPLCPDEVYVPS
ncbi:Protein F09A5.2 [Aphelenchoides avenae]|nr:Protein F09A5.2 [Aphelenchus avenae]